MTHLTPARFLETVRSVVGDGRNPIGLHEPTLAGREWEYVKECIDTGWISSVGKFVDRMEAELALACEAKHAVAVASGTAALHVALVVAGVRPGDEVLIPALTFVATANSVSHCGATPHFVDSEADTLGMDPEKLERYLARVAISRGKDVINRTTGQRIAAIVPVHVFGHPVRMREIDAIARAYSLPLVEDATEAIGSTYCGRRVGADSSLAVFSFNGNKTITTGGGGAVVANDAELARRIKHLTTTAKKPHKWAFDHDEIAFNYRMPNINAALGVAQLEQLDGFVARKRRLAKIYEEAFSSLTGLKVFKEQPFARSNYWLNAVLLDPANAGMRDDLLAVTNEHGIMTRPVWTLMHRLPMYKDCPRMDLSTAEDLESRIINLPSTPTLVRAS